MASNDSRADRSNLAYESCAEMEAAEFTLGADAHRSRALRGARRTGAARRWRRPNSLWAPTPTGAGRTGANLK